MTVRLRCCIPFCTHTRGPRKHDTEPLREGGDWICGKHWMAIPKQTRRVRYRSEREVEKAIARDPMVREYWLWKPSDPRRAAAHTLWQRYDRIWKACKRIAIEKAMGIA